MASVADIEKLLASQTKELETKMLTVVEKAKTEILTSVNQTLSQHAEKFVAIEEKIETLTEKDLQDEVEKRQNNVIFYKIAENENSQEALHEAMINMLNEIVGSNFEIRDINAMYRLGRKQEGHVRPVIIKFVSLLRKELIMKNRKKFTGKNVDIADDFPEEIRKRRKNAAPLIKALKEHGFKASLKVDKIRVNGEIWSWEKANSVVKRFEVNETGDKEVAPEANVNADNKEGTPRNKRIRSPNQQSSFLGKTNGLPPLKLARNQTQKITNFLNTQTTAPKSPIIIVKKTPLKNVQYVEIKDTE